MRITFTRMRTVCISDPVLNCNDYKPSNRLLLPDFLHEFRQKLVNEDPKYTYIFRDALSVYEYFKDFLVNMMGEKNPNEKIMIMQTYSKRGLEQDFLCSLPNAYKSCKYAQRKTFKLQRSSAHLPLDVDLIVREAFDQCRTSRC